MSCILITPQFIKNAKVTANFSKPGPRYLSLLWSKAETPFFKTCHRSQISTNMPQTLVFLIYCTNFKKKHHTKKCWHHILVLNTLQKGGSTQKDCKILHYATILQIKNCESGEWVEADFLWEDVGNRGKMKNSKKIPKLY